MNDVKRSEGEMFVMIPYYDAMKTNDNDVATDAFDVRWKTKAFFPFVTFTLFA